MENFIMSYVYFILPSILSRSNYNIKKLLLGGKTLLDVSKQLRNFNLKKISKKAVWQ